MVIKKYFVLAGLFAMASVASAADFVKSGNSVTINVGAPQDGGAKIVRLQVINDNIIRVQATSEDALPAKTSLMIVPQKQAAATFDVTEEGDDVIVKARNVKAIVNKQTGAITFFDGAGKQLLKEAENGKTFKNFTVPEREYGLKGGPAITEDMKHGLQWHTLFDSPADEAFYGLGQHQSEEFNMKGKNEDLFQYNTKVSIPFVLSNKNYGILWDSYSYCRFGKRSSSTTSRARKATSPAPIPTRTARGSCATRTASTMNTVSPQRAR